MARDLPEGKKVNIGAGALFQRKSLAVYVAYIAAVWSEIDQELGIILGEMLGLSAEDGVKVYLSVNSEQAKSTIVQSIARDKLSDDLADALDAILAKKRKKSRARNDIIHGIWGVCDDYPDALILIDARAHTQWHAVPRGGLAALVPFAGTKVPAYIYGEEDFINVSNVAIGIMESLLDFGDRMKEEYPESARPFGRVGGS